MLLTPQLQPVLYSIEAPGIAEYHNGTITTDNEAIVSLSDNVVVSSHVQQDKGIYLRVSSDRVTAIGQTTSSSFFSSDTFLALPLIDFCAIKHIYYGITVDRATAHSLALTSIVLIVGTENGTTIKLTVPQSVIISVGNITNELSPGREYSFIINRLQTVFIESLDDLTGTKIITDSQVTVFSGHQGASIPNNLTNVDYLVEQIPSITFWGNQHYIAPLVTRGSYTIRILTAYNSTTVVLYCNDIVESFTINEGEFINKTLSDQNYCAIHSNKNVLVVQFSHGQNDDPGGSMMTLVPATIQYLNKLDFSTIIDATIYRHYVNIIVMAQYYQPSMIYLRSGGVNMSLESQEWVPIVVNNITEAYAARVTLSDGVGHIIHLNSTALMTTIVYGFTASTGYGHPGGLDQNPSYEGKHCCYAYVCINCRYIAPSVDGRF